MLKRKKTEEADAAFETEDDNIASVLKVWLFSQGVAIGGRDAHKLRVEISELSLLAH